MKFFSVVFYLLLSSSLFAYSSNCNKHVQFINELYEKFGVIMEENNLKETRIAAMKKIIVNNIDTVIVADFLLREYWLKASQEQKDTFMDVYTDYVVINYSSYIEQYFGKMEIINARAIRESQCVVNTRVMYEENPFYVSYFVANIDNDFYLYDIAFEGVRTIVTYRDEFKYVLSKVGLDGLIEKLRKDK